MVGGSVQRLYRSDELLRSRFRISEHHLHALVPHQFHDSIEWDAAITQSGGEGVPEHVEMDMLDTGVLRCSRKASAYINEWDDLFGPIRT